jgi:hypothetical protein
MMIAKADYRTEHHQTEVVKMEKVIVNTKDFGKLETTAAALEHEFLRFERMNRTQLFRRLSRVKNQRKLVAMIQTCRTFGRRGLERAVKARFALLNSEVQFG